jgi:hypothetical protein
MLRFAPDNKEALIKAKEKETARNKAQADDKAAAMKPREDKK